MEKQIFLIFFFSFLNIIISNPICIENKNNCLKCHPLTNLCLKCNSDNLIPNDNGGCSSICTLGKNYCLECDFENNLCTKCEDNNYYPDKSGGCSYTNNCEISISYNDSNGNPLTENAITIDYESFVSGMIRSVKEWRIKNKDTPNYINNSNDLLQIRHLSPLCILSGDTVVY